VGDEFYTDGQTDITQLTANSQFSQFFRTSPDTHKKEDTRKKERNEERTAEEERKKGTWKGNNKKREEK
jgi:hypothetical protein